MKKRSLGKSREREGREYMKKEVSRRTKNGIDIYSYRNDNVHSFYISLFLRAGSMYESEEENGLTHFLEHALIRNVNSLMDDRLYSVLDASGVEFNASTYSEMVQFYLSGAEKNFSLAAEVLAKLFSPIVLTPAEIRTECDRIKAEIRESDDRTALSTYSQSIVHEGTPLARSILGNVGRISKVTRTRLEEYRRSVFVAGNVFVYVTGSFFDSDLDRLEELLSSVTLEEGVIHDNTAPVSRNFGKRDLKVHVKNADYTMLRFNFDMDMSRVPFGVDDLLYDILLGGYSSRFFMEMSERRGLLYDLSGAVERYRNIGTFFFTFEVRRGSVYEAVELVLAILSQLTRTEPAEEECMKAAYVDNAPMLLDDPRELNFTFAYDNHMMCSSFSDISERSAAYAAITPEDIRRCASLVFRAENLTLTMKGNKKKIDTSRIESIIAKFANGEL